MKVRNPVIAYFALTFAVSWTGAFLVAAPHLARHEPLPRLTGILMFPVMLLGPSVAGIALTGIGAGKSGLRNLLERMFRWRFPARWYAALLIPPALIFAVLFTLRTFVSPAYVPNRFWIGVLFGVPAGFLEEIGWMGYAFPKMRLKFNALAAGIVLGILWSLWHLPVIDYLGSATPHGKLLPRFFLSFAVVMVAMRVLICWMYEHTGSVLLAQLMHVSSTGSLVIFAPRVTAGQEVMWYGLYGAALWLVVAVVRRFGGRAGADLLARSA